MTYSRKPEDVHLRNYKRLVSGGFDPLEAQRFCRLVGPVSPFSLFVLHLQQLAPVSRLACPWRELS
jgi:hypothetical protein